MRFDPPPRRAPRDSLLPMINVVFLLLVFFLISAQIAPRDPFDLTPPESALPGDPPGATLVLFLSAAGELAHAGLTGPEAMAALVDAVAVAAEGNRPGPDLVLRADAQVAAAEVAALLRRLAVLGVGQVDLVTVRP